MMDRERVRYCLSYVAVALTVVGCASTQRLPVRASTQPEATRALEAMLPLLRTLNYPLVGSDPPRLRGGCKLGLVVVPTAAINAGIRAGSRSPCVYFTLIVTEGAVTRLSLPELRAVLAHELGHIHLGHLRARREREEAGGAANLWLVRQRYGRDEETAADEFAVRLLQRLESDHPGSCTALVVVLGSLAAQGGFGAEWLSSHPAPEGRAQRAKTWCNQRLDP